MATIKSMAFIFFICTVLFFALVCDSQATLITFEDLPNPNYGGQIIDGYNGLGWSNFNYYAPTPHDSLQTGYNNSVVSGQTIAVNGYGLDAMIYSTSPGGTFDFISAYIGAAWLNDMNVLVVAFKDNNIFYSQTVTVDTSGAQYFQFNYYGIDKIVFAASGGTPAPVFGQGHDGDTHIALDNLVVTGSTLPTPLPTSLYLLGPSLLGLAGYRKLKR